MITAMHRKAKLGLVMLGSMLALSLGLISGPASAQAEITYYCGGWLYANNACAGASRWLYQVYGWGENGGVCVEISKQSWLSCTQYANTGVYSTTGLSYDTWGQPFIINGPQGKNFVHGIAGSH